MKCKDTISPPKPACHTLSSLTTPILPSREIVSDAKRNFTTTNASLQTTPTRRKCIYHVIPAHPRKHSFRTFTPRTHNQAAIPFSLSSIYFSTDTRTHTVSQHTFFDFSLAPRSRSHHLRTAHFAIRRRFRIPIYRRSSSACSPSCSLTLSLCAVHAAHCTKIPRERETATSRRAPANPTRVG